MNPQNARNSSSRRTARLWSLAALIACSSFGGALCDAQTSPAEAAAPKDHALFVGGDLCIDFAGAAREVVGANAKEVVVLVEGKPTPVRLDKVEGVRLDRHLKLTDVVAQVDNLKAEPVKMAGIGERQQWLEQRFMMDSMQTEAIGNYARSYNAMMTANSLASAAESSSSEDAGYAAASAKQSAATAQASMDRATAVAAQSRSVDKGAGGDMDALEVTAKLSAPKAAREAFVVLVTSFRESAKAPLQYQIHLEPLKKLGPKPEKICITQGGFPKDYILDSYSLYLFADGREVATNLSEKRVDLTADDALKYLTLCYITNHAKETLAASPMRIALPTDFKQQVPAAALQHPVYLTVGTDGAVSKAAADPAGSALDAYVAGVVSKFRFAPALQEGRPVESVVAFNLSDYVR